MRLWVTVNEIVRFIRDSVNGTTAITVDLDSPCDGKMRKTGNPFVGMGIVKRETLNGMIGYIYANAVNRIAASEGKQERDAKVHPWGDMDDKHLFRVHRGTGALYLSMQVRGVEVHGYFAPDGTEIAKDQIKPFFPEKQKSSTQADLDGEVIARDYAMQNIRAIRMKGNEFILISEDEARDRVESMKKVTTEDGIVVGMVEV